MKKRKFGKGKLVIKGKNIAVLEKGELIQKIRRGEKCLERCALTIICLF